MFVIYNKTDEPQKIVIDLKDVEDLAVYVSPKSKTKPIDEKYRKFFQQNEVEWAAILPEVEPVEIKSIGEPVIEKPKPGRPKKGESNVKTTRS